jgi:hypothetical protein
MEHVIALLYSLAEVVCRDCEVQTYGVSKPIASREHVWLLLAYRQEHREITIVSIIV